MTFRRAADLPAALLAGSAWFWGARLLAGALLVSGAGAGPATVLSWVGVAGAGWVVARLGRDGGAGPAVAVAVLVALPEAVALLMERLTRAASVGLQVDAIALAGDVAWRLVLSAGALVLAASCWVAAWGALTSARRRSPT